MLGSHQARSSTNAEAPALEARDLVRVYGATRRNPERRALDSLSLVVRPGGWTALLGPNGSGKSTLVRILATLDRPDSGTVLSRGEGLDSPRALTSYRRSLGVVFQHPGLDKLLTVRENLLAQAALVGLSGAEARGEADRVANLLGLAERMADRVGTLSGGLARRCDLARALVGGPSILILDEATTGLDHDARMAFMDLLASLRADGGRPRLTILMTTHLMDEAERADHVVMIHEGRVARQGSPVELRAALGGPTLRVAASEPKAEHALFAAGLGSRIVGTDRVAAHEPGQNGLARAAAHLAEAGVPFEFTAPTLADAYLAATGSPLSGDQQREALP